MQEMVIYLLKSAGLISLFYLGYYFLLRNETGFKASRIFFLAGILTSLFLPSLIITRTIEMENSPFLLKDLSAVVSNSPAAQPEIFNWWQFAGMFYLAGLGFFLLKFMFELFSLLKLIYTNRTIPKEDHKLIYSPGCTRPFSFFKYVVLDPGQHPAAEIEMILKHERAHVRQWHSLDQLLSSINTYLLWFNPLAWLYRKSLAQNLEYLADREVIANSVSKKEYQKTLLKISVGHFHPTLTNQFYQSYIKKRIMMLNKNTPQKSSTWKTAVLLPFLLLFIFSFNVKTEAQEIKGEGSNVSSTSESSKDSPEVQNFPLHSEPEEIIAVQTGKEKTQKYSFQETDPLIVVDGKVQEKDFNVSTIDPSAIKSLNVLKGENAVEKYGEKGKNGVIEIFLKSKEELKATGESSGSNNETKNVKVFSFKSGESEEVKTSTITVLRKDGTTSSRENALYIVDGKRMTSGFTAESISADNIEAITILKGEKAVHQYGEKASNGVIIITTKK